MRVVVDPGVFISALLAASGPPGQVVRKWLDGEIEVVGSPRLVAELASVLERDKFRAWVTLDDARAFVRFVTASMWTVADPPVVRGVCPDPGDDYLIALFLSARADALVTGDRALLGADIEGVVILSPAEVLVELTRRRG
jgi:uncharacterized protein